MDTVVVKKGNMFGKGVFARKDFKKGEVVIKYHLKPLIKKDYENLPEREKSFVHKHGKIIHLYASPERYVNHSSNPNTIQDLQKKCDIARRDIKRGEEITTDATKDDIP